MNTLIVIALLAVACSSGASAGVISSSNDLMSGSIASSIDKDEIANLKGKNLVFSDYCLSVRDYVFGRFQENTVNTASQVIKSGLKMYWDSSMVQMKALEKLTAQLKNPKAPIEGLDENDSTDKIIASGMRKIQESNSYLEKLVLVFSHAVAAYRSHLGKFSSVQNDSRRLSGAEVLYTSIEQTCPVVSEIEAEVRKRFEQAKAEVVAKDPSMAEVELENVDCATSKRVLNMATVCKFIETAKEPIKGLLGIEK